MIGRDHRRAVRRDQIAEQPQLGGEVVRLVRMVVHVIAREIGEAAGGDAHAIEPELVEPVRGRLEGQMRDAVAGDFVKLPVQRDRVRRRQRAVHRALRRNQTDGADAGGSVAEPFPDLARERGDRRLAAGPGHRRCCRGLARIKSRRRQRQRAARIWRDDEGYAEAARRRMVTGDRDRPRLYRRIDEARAVGLAACNGKEQVARPHRAAVDRQAFHIDSFRLRLDRSVVAEEVAKFHSVPVRPAQ